MPKDLEELGEQLNEVGFLKRKLGKIIDSAVMEMVRVVSSSKLPIEVGLAMVDEQIQLAAKASAFSLALATELEEKGVK